MEWLPHLAGTAGALAIGFLLYGPSALGRMWARGSRVVPPEKMPLAALAWQVAALLALSLVIDLALSARGLTFAAGVILAVAAQAGAVGAWAQKSGTAIAVDVAYAVLGGALIVATQTLL